MEAMGLQEEDNNQGDKYDSSRIERKEYNLDINSFLKEAVYSFPDSYKYFSRCIDGRYERSEQLPPLAFPGADIGQIMCIAAAFNDYDFQNLLKKVGVSISYDYYYILKDVMESVVGGSQNINFHTDTHADEKPKCLGCGHALQVFKTPEDYNLKQQDVDFMISSMDKWQDNGANNITLQGEHNESAIIFLSSGDNYSVFPKLDDNNQVFVFHEPLMQKRNAFIASELIENGILKGNVDTSIVELLENKLNEYTYFHLNETSKRLADGLPLYKVSIDSNGNFRTH